MARGPGRSRGEAVLTSNPVTHAHTNYVSRGENTLNIQSRGRKEGREVNGKMRKQGKSAAPGKELCALWEKSILRKSRVI